MQLGLTYDQSSSNQTENTVHPNKQTTTGSYKVGMQAFKDDKLLDITIIGIIDFPAEYFLPLAARQNVQPR